MNIPNPYESKHYKKFIIVPLLLIAIALFFIPQIPKGIDLRGGQLITVYSDDSISPAQLQAALAEFNPSSVRTFDSPSGKGFEIELPVDENFAKAESLVAEMNDLNNRLVQSEIAKAGDVEELREQVLGKAREIVAIVSPGTDVGTDPRAAVEIAQELFLNEKSAQRDEVAAKIESVVHVKQSSFKEVGSSLSKFFFNKTQEVVIFSFVLSAIIIFLVFRSFVPSVAVMFGATADIIITAGVMGLIGIPLSLASVAALLMLIGFSLDTDVMLTARVIKRKEGTAAERAFEAMKTGLTMNLSVLISFGVLLSLSLFLQIPFYYQVGSVAVIGACVDAIATWMGNAPLVLQHAQKKERQNA
jgi:preprotein translocase subunit SecF